MPLIMTSALFDLIPDCMIRDRHALRHGLREMDRGRGGPDVEARLAARIAQSQQLAARRRDALPQPRFPAELPVVERLNEIRELIRDHQVVVLCGETGSGKSTQLPKICLALGRGVFGRIGHTQPRRIAARSLAARIAAEIGQEVGQSVGFKVRFHDRIGDTTHLKLMTDGILLAEIQKDRFLGEYDTLIIDEAHERSLNIDFLLGYLQQLLPRRPDLKVIITSATIDPQRFSKHFRDAPIIEVSGRTYPVELRYRPPDLEEADERDEAMQQAILDAVDELSGADRGDILVFLSGEREIRETAEHLRKHKLKLTEVLPLYARLSPGEQSRIFQPSGLRRIVLATNVAETSLTVPGIRYVIDTGYARISRYSARSKIQRLPVEGISKASADQRKGRCGRVAPGICIRLYSEEDFVGRPDFTEPEIQRTNLAAVILQMKALGFGDIEAFPFVDPPDSRLVHDGYRVLDELGAVDGLRKITKLGRRLASLPVDPRIGRMLLEAAHTHCLRELLVIAAALAVQDPRDRPLDKQQVADAAHALFKHEESDFLGALKLWDFLEEHRRHQSRRKFTDTCRQHFLSATRVREWHDIHAQLRSQMHELGYRDNEVDPGYETIHKAILSGLLSHVGLRPSGTDREYQGARNSKFFMFPGSGVYARQPKWLVAAELVETTRLYARTVAAVQPEWIESLAGHLVKRSYSDPHWQPKAGQVGAYEKVTLFGLPVVPRRRVNYGPIDPAVAREIFIRFGLVEGDIRTRAPFWKHNQGLIQDLHDMEARSRRRDILVDEEVVYAFYAKRIPDDIYSVVQLENWLRRVSKQDPKLLHMRMADLLRSEADQVSEAQFPDHLAINGMHLPLEYHFEPGSEADGVTLVVPAAVLNQISQGRADWLVPGLIEEKIVSLIKGLPKALRRQFVPVPDYAKRALHGMSPADAPLVQTLAVRLKQLGGPHIPEDAWQVDTLPDFLRMRIRVVEADGKTTIAAARDLAMLQQRYAGQGSGVVLDAGGGTSIERTGMHAWDCGALPDVVESQAGGLTLRGYPALVDEGDSVALRVLDSAGNAEHAHRLGLRRLLMLAQAQTVRYLRKQLPGLQQMRLQYAKAAAPPEGIRIEGKADLEEELVALAFDQAFLSTRPPVRNADEFDACLEQGRAQVVQIATGVAHQASEILTQYHQVRARLARINQINWLISANDMRTQLDRLIYRGFLHTTPVAQLPHLARYLRALELRIDKLQHNPARDQQQVGEMARVLARWQERDSAARSKGLNDPRLEEIRWLLEELRISLFAQEVRTALPVSLKRVEKRWQELGL